MYTVTAYSFLKGYNIGPATASSTSTKDATSSGGGLSTGGKAGIGVGVGVGVIALLALLGFFYVLGRRRGNKTEKPVPDDQQPVDSNKPIEPSELDGSGGIPGQLQTRSDASELGGQGDGLPRRELEGVNDWPPVELDTNTSHRGLDNVKD